MPDEFNSIELKDRFYPCDCTYILGEGQATIEEYSLSIESDRELADPSGLPKLRIKAFKVRRISPLSDAWTTDEWIVSDLSEITRDPSVLNWAEFMASLREAVGRFLEL